jgi:hypothetical protein
MDITTARDAGEVIVGGMSKGEFLAVLCLGAILLAFILWYIQWLFAPIKASQIETSSDVKKMLSMIKSDEEIKQIVSNSMYEHTFACEGKKLMPKVLEVVDRNTRVIEKHSQSNDKLAEAINSLKHQTHGG